MIAFLIGCALGGAGGAWAGFAVARALGDRTLGEIHDEIKAGGTD